MPHRTPPEQRFWARVDKRGPDECWYWLGTKRKTGYGSIGRGGRGNRMIVHRWAYEHFVAPIPAGLEIDHTCHDPQVCKLGNDCPHRRCVNPAHLRATTRLENVRHSNAGRPRAERLQARTHCKRGHEFTPENTYLFKVQGYSCRSCKACSRDQVREYRAARRRAQAEPDKKS